MTAASRRGMHRVFFALWPDVAAAHALASVCAGDRDAVLVEDLHLTLVFIGALSTADFERLPLLAAQLRCAPFELCLDQTEYWERPRVRVAVPRVVPVELLALRQQLLERLAAAGIGQSRSTEPEFRAHVSLTRAGASPEGPVGMLAPVAWHTTHVTLAVTEPAPGGAHYRRAASLALAASGA